jgi:tetratricopeptide (TPR) repeat protein
MSDNPPEPVPPAEVGTTNTVTNVSGGVNLDAQHDVNIGGDVVGRDKMTTDIDTGGVAYTADNASQIVPTNSVAILIDYENLILGLAAKGDIPTSAGLITYLRSVAAEFGNIVAVVAYADWDVVSRKSGHNVQRELAVLGVETRYMHSLRNRDTANKQIADYILVTIANVLILVTSDRDVHPSVEAATKRGKRVVIITPSASSHELSSPAGAEIRRMSNMPDVSENVGAEPGELTGFRAIKYYEQRLLVAREISNRLSESAALESLGITYFFMGEYRRAIENHERALIIAREIGNRYGESTSLSNLGNAYMGLGITQQDRGDTYRGLGEMREATEFYEQALIIAREIGDRHGEGTLLRNLGTAYMRLGIVEWNKGAADRALYEMRKAPEFYEQALIITREIGDWHGEGTLLNDLDYAYTNLSIAQVNQGDYQNAIRHLDRALTIARETGHRQNERAALGHLSHAHMNLGSTQLKQGANRHAIENLERALAYARKAGDQQSAGEISKILRNLQVYADQTQRPDPDLLLKASRIDPSSKPTQRSAKREFKISLAYPKLLSKRFSSVILVQIFFPEMRSRVLDAIDQQFPDKQPTEHMQDSQLKLGQKVKIKVFSPEITFSEPVVKKLDNGVNVARFIAKPGDNCYPGSHQCILSISDDKSNIEYESITFTTQIVDFAFDHISRPLLSRTMSVILGIGSLTMFILTLLGQIDTTLGLTSGTVAGAIAGVIYLRFFSLFQQPKAANMP